MKKLIISLMVGNFLVGSVFAGQSVRLGHFVNARTAFEGVAAVAPIRATASAMPVRVAALRTLPAPTPTVAFIAGGSPDTFFQGAKSWAVPAGIVMGAVGFAAGVILDGHAPGWIPKSSYTGRLVTGVLVGAAGAVIGIGVGSLIGGTIALNKSKK